MFNQLPSFFTYTSSAIVKQISEKEKKTLSHTHTNIHTHITILKCRLIDDIENPKELGSVEENEGGKISSSNGSEYQTAAHAHQLSNKSKRTASALFIVAFLGSLDDLTLIVPMLVGEAFSWQELGSIM
jgi:hypothetical protein